MSLRRANATKGAVAIPTSQQHTSRHRINADASRSEQEFEKLYLECYKNVYNYVSYRMSNDAEAEDIVAEAFLLAARSFDKFDPSRAKFSTWVNTIAINCMKTYWKRQHPTAPIDDVPENFAAIPSSEDALADRDQVNRLLACLDNTERELVLLKYREGFKNVEIADTLNMNASTVSTILARALAKMRDAAEGGPDGR